MISCDIEGDSGNMLDFKPRGCRFDPPLHTNLSTLIVFQVVTEVTGSFWQELHITCAEVLSALPLQKQHITLAPKVLIT